MLGESIPTRLVSFDARYLAADASNPGFFVK